MENGLVLLLMLTFQETFERKIWEGGRNIIYTDSKEEIKIWKDLMNLDISEYVLVSTSHEIYSLVLKK